MSKLYTTKTAALKATTIDSNIIDAKKIFVYPGAGDKTDRVNILDLIEDAKTIYDERGTNTTENDIWGRSVEINEDKTYIRYKWLNAVIDDETKSNIAYVIYNKAFNADDSLVLNIECDRLKSAIGTFATPSLITFSGDLSNLENGSLMFANSSLNVCEWNLLSLADAQSMFEGSTISSFTGDLPSLLNAKAMFKYTGSLDSFSGNLDTLFDAESMFESSSITSFKTYAPYLYKGTNMFANSSIADITVSFSNLLTGVGMFENTNLSPDSVKIIAETLPQINGFTYAEDGTKTYPWANGVSFKYYTPIWSDEKEDTENSDNYLTVSADDIGEIMITWQDTSVLSKEEKAVIIYDYFKLMTLKGWTVVTNLYEDLTDEDGNVISPSGIYYRAVVLETDDDATHIDNDGNYYRIYIASVVHFPEYGFKNTEKWIHVNSEADIPFTALA